MDCENKKPKASVSENEFDTLPDSQDAHAQLDIKYDRDEIAPIIDRILSIAKEICCLSELEVPVEAPHVAKGFPKVK
ncbi:hypothetical protein [Sporomusa sp.]|uniref:hypothetical protein n=1 Tax=Sporomusa sp. TaxID=2078658 RepID=UPI002C6F3D8D|nr:hypothetical protein [Sporomusa sp.]HWR45542.1 hypothetical protein [Sporomusa sp.]